MRERERERERESSLCYVNLMARLPHSECLLSHQQVSGSLQTVTHLNNSKSFSLCYMYTYGSKVLNAFSEHARCVSDQ